jgi:hypothetical protein
VSCVAILGALAPHSGQVRTYAAAATPPGPPTFVPTPIGSPPLPPTLTPAAVDTATPSSTPTAVPGATQAVATPTTVAKHLNFTLDAARVAHINDPGDFGGLSAVKPGSHVWLMLYYTVHALPHSATRTTSYTVTYDGKTLFKVAYRGSVKSSEIGRFSRYQVFNVPGTLPYGRYVFHASLTINKIQRTKSWTFSVGRREIAAKTSKIH